uniref:Uncharacterized protein n=1 Tax=Enterobacter asburiae TaxID=61645 RepID=A0A217EU23_ENTAS|nr:hypothetical protein [Enterobacter asburiae]
MASSHSFLLGAWSDGVSQPPITIKSQWRSLILTAGCDYWHVYMSKKRAGGKNIVK